MNDQPAKIFVPGGAGYLGSALVPRLLEAGYAVHVLDDFRYHPVSLMPHFIHPRFSCERGDVRDDDALKRGLEDAAYIVNLAALVGAPLCAARETEARRVNYEAALRIHELRDPARQGYLFPNTTSGYGSRNPVAGLCTEDTPQEPISVYGQTKVEAEQALLAQDNVVTFRFTTVFGLAGRVRLDLMPNDFMWKALRLGYLIVFEAEFKRSFIHVTDVARAIMHTIEHFDAMKGQAYNIGHERMNKSKRELAEEVARLTGCYLHFNELREDPDKRNYFVSFEKVQGAGFIPEIGWDDGLAALHEGLKTLHWTIPHANVEYY